MKRRDTKEGWKTLSELRRITKKRSKRSPRLDRFVVQTFPDIHNFHPVVVAASKLDQTHMAPNGAPVLTASPGYFYGLYNFCKLAKPLAYYPVV
ncbi:MAG: hypothetical protein US62_C0036G0014 [Candidatus Woesebacteria bacterium GW2011_GWA1_37_8]|uniref:Uncharacterized protein n=2 Tax=Candidatus Woeseibacteriota TaxID=1752722 RepID=A0A0G0NLT0_9BACT|nr:MAG: hypothetical protein US62_C0036G0014 [Candidatus Woesebacteria bacterium GW2011_GWA1_37_8]KKQ86864.1 MAG: hypothetical protein UT10_C0015G0005 [Candidatus Woesebacteria bacterium GW2011_GWB1_38_8b]